MKLRRTFTIALHWALAFMLILLISDATWTWLYWLFGVSAFAMSALALFGGLMNRPGPALGGVLRAAHPWMHRALYALLAWVGAITLWAQVTESLNARDLFQWYMILTGAVMFHAIFHLWRHTALNDGALRQITPQVIHKYL
jgi:hypothetical protein